MLVSVTVLMICAISSIWPHGPLQLVSWMKYYNILIAMLYNQLMNYCITLISRDISFKFSYNSTNICFTILLYFSNVRYLSILKDREPPRSSDR